MGERLYLHNKLNQGVKNRRGVKTITAFILCGFLCFSACAVFMTGASAGSSTTISEDEESLKQLKAQLARINQQRSNLNQAKGAAGSDKLNAYAQKILLENDISLLDEEISVTTKLIADYQSSITSLIDRMYKEQEKIDTLYDIYDRIVVYYYKNGTPQPFELLLESESFSAFLTKKDYVEYILKYMKKIGDDIAGAKIDLQNTASIYQASQNDLKTYSDGLILAKEEYETQVAELENLVSELQGDIQMTEKQIEEFQRQAKELEKQIADLNKAIADKYTYLEGDYTWPIAANYWGDCVVTSGYGNRKDPFTGLIAFHNGVDIAAPFGTPVQSVKSGVVIRSEYSESYGNVVVVSHGDGTATLYAHLSKRLVDFNDRVLQNQVIGKVGATGRANGNHLHFGVYKGSELTDPAEFLDKYFKNALDRYGYLK